MNNFNDIGKKNTLTVEFKTRYSYIQHPETGEWGKREYNEIAELTFPDYETATAYTNEWIEIWQEYSTSGWCYHQPKRKISILLNAI